MTATLTGDGAALYAAIIAAPDEDTPRLVFADWLDENAGARVKCALCKGEGEHRSGYVKCDGHGVHDTRRTEKCVLCFGTGTVLDTANAHRAEFIRVQCELGRLETVTLLEHLTHPLKKREKELRTKYERAWRAAGACLGACKGRKIRGFECGDCFGTGDRGGLLLRTKADVKAARSASVGCCNRNADNMACDCLERAIEIRWARGFPDAVECRLADCGAAADVTCERCGGDGDPNTEDSVTIPRVRVCPACSGRGTVRRWVPSAWALAVVRAHPVTRFVATDFPPVLHAMGKWGWTTTELLHTLPRDVVEQITPDEYATADAATDALARALCALVRASLTPEGTS